jgi:hypothetical protein
MQMKRNRQTLRKLTRFVFPQFAIFLLDVLLVAPTTAAEHGWMVRQTAKGAGPTELYSTAHGFKYVYLTSGLTIMATAPKWQTFIFNPREKTCYAETLSELRRQVLSLESMGGQEVVAKDWHKEGAGTFLGHPATLYKFEPQLSHSRARRGETWYAKDIPVYKEFAEYYAAVCGLPALDCIPLQSKYGDDDGHSWDILVTQEIKPFEPPIHFWEVPAGYKTKKSAFGLADNLEEMLRQENQFGRIPH